MLQNQHLQIYGQELMDKTYALACIGLFLNGIMPTGLKLERLKATKTLGEIGDFYRGINVTSKNVQDPKGAKTYFLPFNRGHNNGKGNPPVEGKEKTYYLWEEILGKDSLLDIMKRFYFIENREDKAKRRAIFQRYHQLAAVRKIVADLEVHKAGMNYLLCFYCYT